MRRLLASALSVPVLAATAMITSGAQAAAEPDWDELARCESGGNWSSTVGHYEGGIQFDPNTWDAYGGGQYASSANQATREQQIAIGRKVLAAQGYGAWPGCSASTGWEGGGTSSKSTQSVRQSSGSDVGEQSSTVRRVVPEPRPQIQRVTLPADAVATLNTAPKVAPPGGSLWTVARGDTLTSIAAKHPGVKWEAIRDLNRDVVEHADWIFPGERLAIPAPMR